MSKIEYSTKEYDKFEVIGPYVLIEKFKNSEHKVGDIIIPDAKQYLNNKMEPGKIIQIGRKAKEMTSLEVGDYVLYDFCSAFSSVGLNVITHCENIIMQVTEEEAGQFLNGELL
jgi:co-chaperonin GroES (HSP10)